MHAYALLQTPPSDFRLPDGIAGPLTLWSQGSLAAVVEPDLAIAQLQADETQLLQAILNHDRIIHQLFQHTTILPLRFALFPSRDSLLAHLATHQDHYLGQLKRLANQAEYLVRFVPRDPPATAIAPEVRGKAYFLAKKQRLLAQEEYQQQQQAELHHIQTALAAQYPLHGTDDQQRLYLLVPIPQQPMLLAAIAQLEAQYATWSIHLGEPLAPFHFVQAVR